MPLRVLINGAQGRMGKLACEAIAAHPDFDLVARTGRDDCLKSSIRQAKPKIVVDLTTAEFVWENCQIIIEENIHPVIGTSGLNQAQIEKLTAIADKIQLGGLIIPNFSIGAVLMMQYSAQIAKYMPNVEIVEAHHIGKLDSPSSTAMMTAEKIQQARKQTHDTNTKTTPRKEIIAHARGATHAGISIHSLRLPGVVAKQEVIFGDHAETLTLQHNTLHREAFMPGLILACQKVRQFKTIQCGLEHCLTLD